MNKVFAGDIELLAQIFDKTPEQQAAEMGIDYSPSLGRRRAECRAHRETMAKLQAVVFEAHQAVEKEQGSALNRCRTPRQRRDCIRAYEDYARLLTKQV